MQRGCKRCHFPKRGINLLGMVVIDKVYRHNQRFDHYAYALTHQPSQKCIKTFFSVLIHYFKKGVKYPA